MGTKTQNQKPAKAQASKKNSDPTAAPITADSPVALILENGEAVISKGDLDQVFKWFVSIFGGEVCAMALTGGLRIQANKAFENLTKKPTKSQQEEIDSRVRGAENALKAIGLEGKAYQDALEKASGKAREEILGVSDINAARRARRGQLVWRVVRLALDLDDRVFTLQKKTLEDVGKQLGEDLSPIYKKFNKPENE